MPQYTRRVSSSGGLQYPVNQHTFEAAGKAIAKALQEGKSPEEIRKAGDDAADAEYRRIKGSGAESETLDSSGESIDAADDQEINRLFDLYLTAVLDVAHGQFENLSYLRKRRAALVVSQNVRSFDDFCADLPKLE